jgi:hypothetical protein
MSIRIWERAAQVVRKHTRPDDPPERRDEVWKVFVRFVSFCPLIFKFERFKTLGSEEIEQIRKEVVR